MFAQLKAYVMGALALALVAAGLAAWWQYERANGLVSALSEQKGETAKALDAAVELNKSVGVLKQQRAADQLAMDALSRQANALTVEKDLAHAKLDSYRTRLKHLAEVKPGLVGRLSTNATRHLMSEFCRETGGAACDGAGEAVPPRPPAPGVAEPPQGGGADAGGDRGQEPAGGKR
jgi:hypothetical protein